MNNRRVLLWTLVGWAGIALQARAEPACDKTQYAINSANAFILTNNASSPDEVEIASWVVKGKGKDINAQIEAETTFERCNVLTHSTADVRRDDGTTQMAVHTETAYNAGDWQQTQIIKLEFKGKILTQGSSTKRFIRDEWGRITDAVEQFTLDERPGETRTHFDYDDANRVVRSVAHSTLQFFEETIEYQYDEKGRLVRAASGKEIRKTIWDEKGRWLRSEKETNHAYSVLFTVDTCEKWDEHQNCLSGISQETEKYPKKTTQYHTALQNEYRYY
ncbi:hypothetical protein ACP26E_10580 [Franconibacter pulveris 601]|uniref:hypothetical protein n=1 Tax=Franconibacter pulveris TaxID=435910 RepID=UPI00046614D5|nr:hypothetical protein [Franconibacter pulveris]